MPKYILTVVALILATGLSGLATARATALQPTAGIGAEMAPCVGTALAAPRAGAVAEPSDLMVTAPRIGPQCEPGG